MLRFLFTLMIGLLPAAHTAHAQVPDRDYSDMPVYVLYCDEDPGRINAGGGKAPSPEQLIEDGTCTPGDGVALTFLLVEDDWDFEEDDLADEIEWDVDDDAWFNRCDTDANGYCDLNSPMGFDIVIGVVLHEGTVLPGYEPAFFQSGTHNFTEFAGYGLALIPEEGTTPQGTTDDHQTLALQVNYHGDPANVLTEWKINGVEEDLYLAASEGGWISTIVAPSDEVEIDIVTGYYDGADITVSCGAHGDANHHIGVDIDGTDFTVAIGNTTNDIRCDVNITD